MRGRDAFSDQIAEELSRRRGGDEGPIDDLRQPGAALLFGAVAIDRVRHRDERLDYWDIGGDRANDLDNLGQRHEVEALSSKALAYGDTEQTGL